MAHDHHHHNHDHHGHHHVVNYNKAFAWGISLNIIYVIIECSFGFHINSLALLSDAGHNLGDVLSLLLAWAAEFLVKRKSFGQFTYGLKRASILIAFANALLLVLALGAISWEAIQRFYNPVESNGIIMCIVAFVGILINGFTAFLFYKSGPQNDVNIRGAFTHMLSDAMVSAGVVIAGIVIYFTSWIWLDPAISIAIVLVILATTWNLFKDSTKLLLDAAPKNIDVDQVKVFLQSLTGVAAIHDLHIWNLSTKETALTAHLIMPDFTADDAFLKNVEHDLHHKFKVTHVTIQIERGNNCKLEKYEC